MTIEQVLDYLITECDTRIAQTQSRGVSSTTLAEFREFLGNFRKLMVPEEGD